MAEPPLLEQFLATKDAYCPVCGYSLHRLTTRQCPECGVPIELSIRTPDPRLASWITGLVGVSMFAGFFVVAGIWMVFMMIQDGYVPRLRDIWPLPLGFVVGIGMLGAFLLGRRRYRKSSAPVRWGVNGGCVAAMFVLALLFFNFVN